jgi:hypothetical protein
MKLAPQKWSGSASSLIDSVISSCFLSPESIQVWMTFLKKKFSADSTTLILPAPHPDLRQKWGQDKLQQHSSGLKILFSDTAALSALMTYFLHHTKPTPEVAATLYLQMPFHNYDMDRFTKTMGFSNNAQTAGWNPYHLRPVQPAENWSALDKEILITQSLQFLNPLNLYVFPHFNKTGGLFAEDLRFQSLVLEKYTTQYQDIFSGLTTGIDFSHLTKVEDFNIEISADSKISVVPSMAELVKKINPQEAFDLKLVTVSEKQMYHSRILDANHLMKGTYDIKLDYKLSTGEIITVGYYRLNIKDLFVKNFLVRTEEGIKLSIYKTEKGFAISARKSSPAFELPL